jgi:hypothetical protein
MAQPLTADDLLPLVAKLPHDEQVRLAQFALRAARDATRRVMPLPIEECPCGTTSSLKTRKEHRGRARAGRRPVRRGEIRWYTFAVPDKRRPHERFEGS